MKKTRLETYDHLVIDTDAGGIVSEHSDGVPTISYALLDSTGTPIRVYDAERIYYSASTVKVGVLVAELREIQNGAWGLDDEKTVTHDFTSVVQGVGRFTMPDDRVDPGMGMVGDIVERAWVLNRMITVSANCGTNVCFEELGPEKIAAVFADAGALGCGMRRPYSDDAAEQNGITNTASALGLAKLMSALVRGKLLDPEWTKYAMRLLHERQDPTISAVALKRAKERDELIYTGGKGGSVDGIAHDFAFIERNGDTLCLAVCTRGYSYTQAGEAIGVIANALLDDAYA